MFLCFCSFQVRHNIRPYFLTSDSHKCVYDVITWASTQIAVSYTVVPFVLLAVGSSLKFYRYTRRSESQVLSLCNQRALAVAHPPPQKKKIGGRRVGGTVLSAVQ